MVIPNFDGKRVYLDTAPLIYFIEKQSPHHAQLTQFIYS